MPLLVMGRRLQRAELRAARSRRRSYQLPLTPQESMKLHPDAGGLHGRPVRQRARHRQADLLSFDERGRLWVIEAIDYPNTASERRAGQRSDQDLRGHQRRWPGRQVHDLRRPSERPDEPGLRQRRRRRHGDAEHPLSQGHRRRRQGRRPPGAEHRLGHQPTRTRSPPTCSMGPTIASGASSATPASTGR